MTQQAMVPIKGMVWNPLRELPRNMLCPCKMTGLKFKACCLPKLPLVVPENVAKVFKEQMAKPDFIFRTAENEQWLEENAERLMEESKAAAQALKN